MKFATRVITAASTFALILCTSAATVEFRPETVFDLYLIGDEEGVRDAVSYPAAQSQSVQLNSRAGTVISDLQVIQETHLTSVTLASQFSFEPVGSVAETGFSGTFTISEPSFVEFFGYMDSNSEDPAATSTIYASNMPVDQSETHYEYEFQQGQNPESISINGVAGPLGFLEGNVAASRLLQPGTYSFDTYLAAFDNSLGNDLAFSTAGTVGFTIRSAVTPPPPEPPSLSLVLQAVQNYVASGEIGSKGVGKSLVMKLENASRTHIPSDASQNILNAFLQELSAQRSKNVSEAAADDLASQVELILAALF